MLLLKLAFRYGGAENQVKLGLKFECNLEAKTC
jgi:hypothetical protein